MRRSFSTISPINSGDETVLRTEYKATTNRMLRVAVNGFMESLSVVLGVMEELGCGCPRGGERHVNLDCEMLFDVTIALRELEDLRVCPV